MKVLLHMIMIVLIILLSYSCKKEVIPGPNDPVEPVSSYALYVKGTVNGNELNMIIDDVHYTASPTVIGSPPVEWYFDVYKMTDTIPVPQFSFGILNHDQSSIVDYQDLVLSTSAQTMEFVDEFSPLLSQLGRVRVFYAPNENDLYVSDLATNTPLDVLEAKDTLVDGLQYRIVEVSGTVNLKHYSTLDSITIENFHSRVAMAL